MKYVPIAIALCITLTSCLTAGDGTPIEPTTLGDILGSAVGLFFGNQALGNAVDATVVSAAAVWAAKQTAKLAGKSKTAKAR